MLLRLEGQVRGPWVGELRRACDQMLGTSEHSGNQLVLDLAEVSFLDADAVALFHEMMARGIVLRNCSMFIAEQLKEVADVDR
jgi:anti-anti-sigma regulatory factor